MESQTDQKKETKSYHFSLGDSSSGSVGVCARIRAGSKAEAVAKLKAAIEWFSSDVSISKVTGIGQLRDDFGVEYIRAYFNPDAIFEGDIDEVDGLDDEGRKEIS